MQACVGLEFVKLSNTMYTKKLDDCWSSHIKQVRSYDAQKFPPECPCYYCPEELALFVWSLELVNMQHGQALNMNELKDVPLNCLALHN